LRPKATINQYAFASLRPRRDSRFTLAISWCQRSFPVEASSETK